jgi:hypothetical protein
MLAQVDSRETARVWLEKNLPEGARVWLEFYSPYLDPERFAVDAVRPPAGATVEWYRERGYEYAVFSEDQFGRYYRQPERYQMEIAAYERLFDDLEEVRIFDDGGYEVRVYAVPR